MIQTEIEVETEVEGMGIKQEVMDDFYSSLESGSEFVYNNNALEQEVDIVELNLIRDKIETMSKFNQVGVLRILSKNKNIILNENKYGVHINLTELPKTIIDELHDYINYVKTQEIELSETEQQKTTFKNIYFTKDNKDITGKNSKRHEL